jgi:diguanylate cyclase (GGDEF)-like protein
MNTELIHDADDHVQLIDDEPTDRAGKPGGHPWRILLVDDDEQVHTSTLFALSGTLILGRPLEFLHAYNAGEARRVLADEEDIAVVFLDVVMEAEDAGLKLVRAIREDLGLTELRIILRTGQPGYAPELDAIRDYDINDYRTKAELTRTRLVTSLTAALRSYEQIRTIAYSRRGLEKIVQAAADLFEKRALESLAEGVLTQIAGLLGFSPDGVVCAQRGYPLDGSDSGRLYVVGAVGRYAKSINRPLELLGEPRIERAIRACVQGQRNVYAADYTVLYMKSPGGSEEAVFLDSARPVDILDRQLLEVFATNISVGFSNVYLFHRLNYLAYHDPLTDLPNRNKLVDMLDASLREARSRYVVYLVDIDHFSDINDVLGAPLGDALLRAVAGRLRVRLPSSCQLGRYGGDVLCVVGNPARITANGIINQFSEPFEISGYLLPVTVTLGECQAEPGQGALEVYKNAGLALTQAKREARGRVVTFTEQMAQASRQRMELLQALRRAIREDRLELHYQPQIDLTDGRVVGAEALVRWRGDDGRMISPSIFIPLAEHSGLIQDIGAWVMNEACRQLARWRQEGLAGLKLAINVSAQQIKQGVCAPDLHRAIRAHDLDPRLLEIEVTESMVLEDIDAAIGCLECFKHLGVSVALDDFGTGFSSLSYLHRLPIDCLKVDRAFVREIGYAGHGERIAEMVVSLGKMLKIHTLAEGVETELQAETVRGWGCSCAQGYLYAPALPAAEFSAWVRQRAAG